MSFVLWNELLPELQHLVRVKGVDVLAAAHLAMTCRVEAQWRDHWFREHFSGPRTRRSYLLLGVAIHGSDAMLYKALRRLSRDCGDDLGGRAGAPASAAIDLRHSLLVTALEHDRHEFVLRWCHDYPVATATLFEDRLAVDQLLAAVSRVGFEALATVALEASSYSKAVEQAVELERVALSPGKPDWDALWERHDFAEESFVLRAQREGRVKELLDLVPNVYALDSLRAPLPVVILERALSDTSNLDPHWVWRHCRGDVAATKRALELTPGVSWAWDYCGPADPLSWLDWLVHDAKLLDVKRMQVVSDMGIREVSAASRIRFLDHFKLGWNADLFESAIIEGDIAAVQWTIKHRDRLIRRPTDMRWLIPGDSPREDLFSDLRRWDRGHVIRWLKETGALTEGRYVRCADGSLVRL